MFLTAPAYILRRKATKFCKIFTSLLTVCTVVKSMVKISQNFVTSSEYGNFNCNSWLYELQFWITVFFCLMLLIFFWKQTTFVTNGPKNHEIRQRWKNVMIIHKNHFLQFSNFSFWKLVQMGLSNEIQEKNFYEKSILEPNCSNFLAIIRKNCQLSI